MRHRLTVEVLPLLTTISPLIGAATVIVMSRWNASVVRSMVLSNSTITLVLATAAIIWLPRHETASPGQQLPRINWLSESGPSSTDSTGPQLRGVRVQVAWNLDGWSTWSAFALSLTVWAALCCSSRQHEPQFMANCLGMMVGQALLLAAFFSANVIAATVFLQMAAIPIYLLMGVAGDEERRQAASAWWIWQLIGGGCSLLGGTLLAVSLPWMQTDLVAARSPVVFDTSLLADNLRQLLSRSETAWHLWNHLASWAAALLLLGLLIRLPVFPFQGWYLSSLTAAPPAVAAMIAVAFPMAAVGDWLRLGMPLFGMNGGAVPAILGLLSLAAALQAAVAIRTQWHLKQRIAMLACAMLGLLGLGLSFHSRDGLSAVCLLTLCAGLATSGGMLLTEVVESRYGTRDLRNLTQITRRYPRLAGTLSMCLLGGAGIPIAFGFTALVLQFWVVAGTSPWMLIGQSVVIGVMAASGIEAFAVMMTSPTAIDSAEPPTKEPVNSSDLHLSELLGLAVIFGVLLMVNALPKTVTRDCESAFPSLFRSIDSAQ